MRRDRAIVVVLVLVGLTALAAPRVLAAPTPLEGALELYAAAAYEEALAAFDSVSTAALGVDEQVVVAQHRMLCLMAMGRTAEAERAAARLLALRPAFVLAARDASPRVRTMFDTARRRVLPAIVRERFAAGRRLYDQGALGEARAAFASVSQALGDAALVDSDAALADLRTLADGFLVLSSAAVPAAAPTDEASAARVVSAAAVHEPAAGAPISPTPVAAPPAAAAPDVPAPTLIVDESSALVSFPTDSAVAWRDDRTPPAVVPAAAGFVTPVESTAAAPPTPVAAVTVAPTAETPLAADAPPASVATPTPSTSASAGAPFTPIDIFTYDWRDKDVTAPVPVAQAISGWWGAMGEPPAGTPLGAVEVVIDEHGKVVDAKMYQSVNRVYDAVLLASVGQWRYQPATRGGRPVKYRRISGVVSGR